MHFTPQNHDLQGMSEMLGCPANALPPGLVTKLGVAREVMNMIGRADTVPFEVMLMIAMEEILADPPPSLKEAYSRAANSQASWQQSQKPENNRNYTYLREHNFLGQHEANDEMISPPPAPPQMTPEKVAALPVGTSVIFVDEKRGGLNSGLLQGMAGDMALVMTSDSSRPVAVVASDIRTQG